VDLCAAADEVTRVAAAQARVIGASPEEVFAAAEAAVAALGHPIFARARAASACRRESPVLMRLPDGSLVDGVLDLAFREGAGWTVVDFKTDVELARRRPEYEAQVSLYARAVALATGEEARAVLLSV
jgi:ATP-dependent exoDNAse (exonuclease V) beta subunit